MRHILNTFSLFFVCLLTSPWTMAQQTILKSSLDDLMTIKSVTVAPMFDNVSGIYAQPLTTQLRAIVEDDRQWNLKTFPEGIQTTPEQYEDNPESVKTVAAKNLSDALISGRITKGPQGISIKLNLFLAKDGLLFTQEQLINYSGFEIADLRRELSRLFQQMKSRIPFQGSVLSRKGQQVTIDMGTLHGLQNGSEISVVQIIKLNRHPKHNFIVSTEKEYIGKIIVTKAETSLSFGTIQLERFENVIQPKMKVERVDFVEYKTLPGTNDNPDLSARKDAYAMGDNPQEWIPTANPQYGKLTFLLGLSNYAVSNTLESYGAVNSSQFPTPSISVDGEIWLTPEWFIDLNLRQFILTLSNQLQGSSPGKVSLSTTQIGFFGGYNFLLSENFFGPKFQLLGGYHQLSSTVDTSSPTAYTSMNFSGFALGVAGSMPIDDKIPMNLGAKLLYFLSAKVSESPVTSGASSSARISQLSVFGSYKWTERMNWKGEISYDLYSASFSGTGTRGAYSASSASHTITNFGFGIEYLF